jgi:hypothetical protein
VVQTTLKKRASPERREPRHGKSFNLKGNKGHPQSESFLRGFFTSSDRRPSYLAELMYSMNKNGGQNVTKILENIIMYSYAQKYARRVPLPSTSSRSASR